ncbi:GntR family transcriptional regulator [Robbsia sp. Bb-Pol-6]|uniref:GntR family transcriptional regulator n=1 Tax=Robbsia betulipollinis TaxID=2981849 RepID=A0ABT3ZJY6_9BURK|nr:GntR family transcriptional regulator [Robbsia betulipollinis]MCY0386657.1 GntR family transcriptional regulator [Robbsia betulipollinis]
MSRPASKAAATAPAEKPFSNEVIYARLQKAVLEHRLTPGTRLVEDRLAEAAGVSRTKIREVLGRLAHEGLVTLVPNRGAFIASPSTEQARDVFVTRRMVEPGIARMLCESATAAQVRTLRRHSRLEEAARAKDDRPAIIRLSGEFHVLIAQMAGNEILLRLMREMTSLTCLIITLYDKPNTPACPHTEHVALIDAIEARDGAQAAACMTQHLNHIEHTLDLASHSIASPDIEALFD